VTSSLFGELIWMAGQGGDCPGCLGDTRHCHQLVY